tara:strand:+ start:5070 stop:5261 length:192 start_codon:yes stop_codon:yes gene_type:complete
MWFIWNKIKNFVQFLLGTKENPSVQPLNKEDEVILRKEHGPSVSAKKKNGPSVSAKKKKRRKK